MKAAGPSTAHTLETIQAAYSTLQPAAKHTGMASKTAGPKQTTLKFQRTAKQSAKPPSKRLRPSSSSGDASDADSDTMEVFQDAMSGNESAGAVGVGVPSEKAMQQVIAPTEPSQTLNRYSTDIFAQIDAGLEEIAPTVEKLASAAPGAPVQVPAASNKFVGENRANLSGNMVSGSGGGSQELLAESQSKMHQVQQHQQQQQQSQPSNWEQLYREANARAARAEAQMEEMRKELLEMKQLIKELAHGREQTRAPQTTSNVESVASRNGHTAGGRAGRGGRTPGTANPFRPKTAADYLNHRTAAQQAIYDRIPENTLIEVGNSMVKKGSVLERAWSAREALELRGMSTTEATNALLAVGIETRWGKEPSLGQAAGTSGSGVNGRHVPGLDINRPSTSRVSWADSVPDSDEEHDAQFNLVSRRKNTRLAGEGGRIGGQDFKVGPPTGSISTMASLHHNTYAPLASQSQSLSQSQSQSATPSFFQSAPPASLGGPKAHEGDRISGPGTSLNNGPPQGPISTHNAPLSYAHAAKSQLPLLSQKQMLQRRNRAVQQMLAPPSEPLKFKCVRIGINDTRPLRDIRGKSRDKLIKSLANALGVGKFVVLASTIGNAIVEFYVTEIAYNTVVKQLKDSGAQVLDNFNPFAKPSHGRQSDEACKASIVNRLTHLCLMARTVNLQDTIVDGASQDIKDAVLTKAREITKNPSLTLGRQSAHQANYHHESQPAPPPAPLDPGSGTVTEGDVDMETEQPSKC